MQVLGYKCLWNVKVTKATQELALYLHIHIIFAPNLWVFDEWDSFFFLDCLILQFEALRFPQTSVTVYQSTRRSSLDYFQFYQHFCEQRKSCMDSRKKM